MTVLACSSHGWGAFPLAVILHLFVTLATVGAILDRYLATCLDVARHCEAPR